MTKSTTRQKKTAKRRLKVKRKKVAEVIKTLDGSPQPTFSAPMTSFFSSGSGVLWASALPGSDYEQQIPQAGTSTTESKSETKEK